MQYTVRRAHIKWDNILTLVLLLITIGVIIVGITSWPDTPEIVGYETHIVREGDTLWTIAEWSNAYGDIDQRQIIYDMKEAGATDILHIGDEVQIPIYEED